MIKLNGKEITLHFNMLALRKVRDYLNCKDLSEVVEKFRNMADNNGVKDLDAIIDLSAACVFYGSKEFTSIDEVMDAVTRAEDILPAATEFMNSFNAFYGIKPGEATGEAQSH